MQRQVNAQASAETLRIGGEPDGADFVLLVGFIQLPALVQLLRVNARCPSLVSERAPKIDVNHDVSQVEEQGALHNRCNTSRPLSVRR
jgi:hypothetical protein